MATSLWQRAADFAAREHQHQRRKDGATPYAAHAFRVAMTVRHVFDCDDENIIAAALLHDTIEDCGTDYDDIAEAFNDEVADLVALMTKDMRMVEREREPAYDAQLAGGSWKARMIKLADVFDNLTDAGESGMPIARMLEKAERAVALAENDAQLQAAVAIVRDLIQRQSRADG